MENSTSTLRVFKPNLSAVVISTVLFSFFPGLLLMYGLYDAPENTAPLISATALFLIAISISLHVFYKTSSWIKVSTDSISWKTPFSKRNFNFQDLNQTELSEAYKASFFGLVDKNNKKYSFPVLFSKKQYSEIGMLLNQKSDLKVESGSDYWSEIIAVALLLGYVGILVIIYHFFTQN